MRISFILPTVVEARDIQFEEGANRVDLTPIVIRKNKQTVVGRLRCVGENGREAYATLMISPTDGEFSVINTPARSVQADFDAALPVGSPAANAADVTTPAETDTQDEES